jgi:cobalt/nickel transport system permease protein
MRTGDFDRLSGNDSPVHRLSPALKTVSAILFILAVTLAPGRPGWVFAAAGALLLGAILAGRIPASFLLKRALLLEPVAVAVAGLALLQPSGTARFGLMVVRSTLCLTAVLVLAATTPSSDILAFFRRLRVPSILTSMAALMVRYIFVLGDELRRMRRARRSRTFRKGRARAWRSASAAAGHLFVRSTERAERIYRAMSARGWR